MRDDELIFKKLYAVEFSWAKAVCGINNIDEAVITKRQSLLIRPLAQRPACEIFVI